MLYKDAPETTIKTWITSIKKDHDGFLWLGTWGRGLIKYNPKNGDYRTYRHEPDNPNSLNDNSVLCIHIDRNNVLWLGSNGGGLNRFNPKTRTFSAFTKRNGLPSNVVYGIAEDGLRRLWLTTNKGLSCFIPENNTFINYDIQDGLVCNEFNMGACFKSSTGELYFGSPKGFNRFLAAHSVNASPPDVVLTSFKKFGQNVFFDTPVPRIKKIILDYRDKMITFGFAALHYKNSAKNRYAYKLNGFDKNWIDNGFKREVTYTNLDPGEYLFMVKAANSDGIWNENGLRITLIITPPFWNTWWFYSLMFFAVMVIVYTIHRIHLARVIKTERMKIAEREHLRKQMAADFHDELGHRVTKIALLSKLLYKDIREQPKKVDEHLEQIRKNADSLFCEMKEFVWKLDSDKDSLYDLMAQLKNFSDTLFEKSDIAFRITGLNKEIEKLRLPMDWRQNLLRIFKEGMHNVLKHADNCKNVSLQIAVVNQTFSLALSDDGQGFKIYDVKGGNGINNMKNRAEKINGLLSIQSEPGKGTRLIFKAKLP